MVSDALLETDPAALPPLALECRDLTKRYGETTVVDAVSFDIREGETFALLGPSGCGKTTTLRMIAGLERPTSGEISDRTRALVDGQTFVPPEERGIGLVFQQYALFPHLNVEQNVAFGLKGARTNAQEMLRKVLLDHRSHARIDELSGGEQQRVALARALAPHPTVLLLDEPFANLDASLRDAVRADVKALLRELSATAILVTHDQGEAMGLADRIGVMGAGRLLQVGPPREVYRAPETLEVATTLGEGNCVPARVVDGAVQSALGTYAVDAAAVDARPNEDACVLFVRPEHLSVIDVDDERAKGTGEVELVWFAGSHSTVSIRLDNGTLVKARAHVELAATVGDRVGVLLDDCFCLFPRPAAA